MTLFEAARETIEGLQSRAVMGRVQSIRGLTVIVDQLRIPVGSIVRIESRSQTREPIRGEVVGFQGDASIVMLYDESGGISPGDCCIGERNSATVPVGTALLGRTIDGLGRPHRRARNTHWVEYATSSSESHESSLEDHHQ